MDRITQEQIYNKDFWVKLSEAIRSVSPFLSTIGVECLKMAGAMTVRKSYKARDSQIVLDSHSGYNYLVDEWQIRNELRKLPPDATKEDVLKILFPKNIAHYQNIILKFSTYTGYNTALAYTSSPYTARTPILPWNSAANKKAAKHRYAHKLNTEFFSHYQPHKFVNTDINFPNKSFLYSFRLLDVLLTKKASEIISFLIEGEPVKRARQLKVSASLISLQDKFRNLLDFITDRNLSEHVSLAGRQRLNEYNFNNHVGNLYSNRYSDYYRISTGRYSYGYGMGQDDVFNYLSKSIDLSNSYHPTRLVSVLNLVPFEAKKEILLNNPMLDKSNNEILEDMLLTVRDLYKLDFYFGFLTGVKFKTREDIILADEDDNIKRLCLNDLFFCVDFADDNQNPFTLYISPFLAAPSPFTFFNQDARKDQLRLFIKDNTLNQIISIKNPGVNLSKDPDEMLEEASTLIIDKKDIDIPESRELVEIVNKFKEVINFCETIGTTLNDNFTDFICLNEL